MTHKSVHSQWDLAVSDRVGGTIYREYLIVEGPLVQIYHLYADIDKGHHDDQLLVLLLDNGP